VSVAGRLYCEFADFTYGYSRWYAFAWVRLLSAEIPDFAYVCRLVEMASG
jgi:hypothetical protein